MNKDQVALSYSLAKKVYNGNLTNKESGEVAGKNGISVNSQISYFNAAYRHLINGTKFSGKLSIYIWEYYLSQIFVDFDEPIKKNALHCFQMAIDYHEMKSGSNAISMRKLLDRFRRIIT